jgi:predicted ester cyclase
VSAEDNKALARRFFEWEDRLAAGEDTVERATAELLTPDFRAHIPDAPDLDLEGFRTILFGFVEGFPGFRVTIQDQLAEGDKVATRAVFAGPNRGTYEGTEATGRLVAVEEIVIHRVVDGKIAELWAQFDNLAILQQLGVAPVEASPR